MAHPRRVAKVTSQIKRELGDMFATDETVARAISPGRSTNDLSAVASITAVYVSNDLQVVKAYVSIYSDPRGRVRAMENLKRLEPYVRREIGSRMALRLTPLVLFEYDDSIEEEELVERVLGAEEVRRIRSELDAEAGIVNVDEDEEDEQDDKADDKKAVVESTQQTASTTTSPEPTKVKKGKWVNMPAWKPGTAGPFDFMFGAEDDDEDDDKNGLEEDEDLDDGHLGYDGPAPYRRSADAWQYQAARSQSASRTKAASGGTAPGGPASTAAGKAPAMRSAPAPMQQASKNPTRQASAPSGPAAGR